MAFSKQLLKALASLKITVVSLSMLFVVVFVGTLAQVNLGIYQTQQRYFLSTFIWKDFGQFSLPIFPGAALIGTVLVINLIAVIILKKLYKPKKIGLGLIHAGLVLLLLGSWLTSALGIESQMAIKEGQTLNYSESIRKTELVISTPIAEPEGRSTQTGHSKQSSQLKQDNQLTPESSQLTKEVVIPAELLARAFKKGGQVDDKSGQLPFEFRVVNYHPNAYLSIAQPNQSASSASRFTGGTPAQGIGANINVEQRPLVTRDNQIDMTTAAIEIFNKSKESMGIWLVSRALKKPQNVTVDGVEYELSIRRERYYYPFTITLNDFSHDLYPGTTIPKNFSSLIDLKDPLKQEEREVLIYMNHPLRYAGHTFFQASYGEENTLSIFQIVKNPGWQIPYYACLIMSLGLCIHFMVMLGKFLGRRSSKQTGGAS